MSQEEHRIDPLELKQSFPLLKKWYGPSQRSKHGELPMFWQDLESWPPLKQVMKEFFGEKQQNDGSSGNTGQIADSSKFRDYTGFIDPLANLSLTEKKLILARIKLEDVQDKLSKVVLLAQEQERSSNRSPSPDPVYNKDGIRINTREVRMRNKFTEQKKELMDEMLRLKQTTLQPGDAPLPVAGPAKTIQRKIYMPVKDFPGRNFIGLVIGPRGDTQKRLESATKCKIAIRGKGSVKSGRQGRPEDEVDELHVLVTGPTEDAVDLAAEKVEELLRPLDDSDNVHKQNQLRELAIYNGTYRDDETCHYCQEKGHKQFECPKKRADEMSGAPANKAWGGRNIPAVVCRHCGERSHPSADCPLLRVHAPFQPTMPPMPQSYPQGMPPMQYPPMPEGAPPPMPAVDQNEFMDFWQEVSGAPATSAPYSQQPPLPRYHQQQQQQPGPQPYAPTAPVYPPSNMPYYPPAPPSFPEPPPMPRY